MLYINKRPIPKAVQEKIAIIRNSEAWRRIKSDDIEGIRACFDSLDKEELRNALISEQHGLCAYCMKRIKANSQTSIEHFIPIKCSKDGAIDYKNMLACCDGGRTSNTKNKKVLCCDASKGDIKITINPQDKTIQDKITYDRNGILTIKPFDTTKQNEIDHILHLNGVRNENGDLKYDTNTQIVKGRRDTYKFYTVYMERISRKARGDESKIIGDIKRMISKLESADIYMEYQGVMIYFLKRRLRAN